MLLIIAQEHFLSEKQNLEFVLATGTQIEQASTKFGTYPVRQERI